MRRVCVLCEKWASGGIESFISNVVLNLDLELFSVEIVAARMEESIFTENLKNRNVVFHELSGTRNAVIKNGQLFLNLLKERKYDVIHVNAFHAGTLYYLFLARKTGVEVRIAHSHNTALAKKKMYYPKMLIHRISRKLFLREATILLSPSKKAAEFMFGGRGHQRIPLEIMPNGISCERFRFNSAERNAVREEMGISGRFVVGNVGRLCEQKNQGFLLRVFSKVVEICPNAVLLLVGEGQDRRDLEREAKRLGIFNKTVFCGSRTDVERLFWAMDMFAFPSLFEGLGIVAVEAQASGLPIVLSEHIPEEARLLSDVFVVPLEQGETAWANAILAVKNEESRRTLRSQEIYSAGYDIRDVVEQMKRIYLR